jgi:prepilin-type N-terminal cleavage/methylation domain-containing protein
MAFRGSEKSLMRLVTLRRSPTMSRRAASGFSLIELLIVLAVALVVSGYAIVNGVSAVRGLRLNEATIDYSNLLQEARISAVKNDAYYTVMIPTSGDSAFVNVKDPATYAPGDPMMTFPTGVIPKSYTSGPNADNLKSQFLPTTESWGTVQSSAFEPTFSPRGLPCTPGGGGCPSPANPTSYITFFQNNQNGKWAAVTVSPAGRIRRWSYEGSSWSPMN